MNGAFLHVAINHVPVIGIPGATLLLLGGMMRKSRDIIQAAFIAFILLALFTVAADQTGGPAARVLRGYPEVTHAVVHEHAEAADFGVAAGIVMGVLSLIGLFLSRNGLPPKAVPIVILIAGLWASTVMARVAHLGGLIRHPEVANMMQPPPASAAATIPADKNPAPDHDHDH